jgi:prepilin-type N-terminal cleavage/methylation domain-containing protein
MKNSIIGDSMKRPGFTLIELMVVAAVFSVLFLVATGVYTSAFSRQKTVQAKQRVATEARSALETIARSVRVGNIDYAYYRTGCAGARCDLTLTQSIIAVRDTANAQTCFRVNATNQLQTTTDCSQASPTWTTMTPDDLVVTGFTAFISPASDPYLGPPTMAANVVLIQPRQPLVIRRVVVSVVVPLLQPIVGQGKFAIQPQEFVKTQILSQSSRFHLRSLPCR